MATGEERAGPGPNSSYWVEIRESEDFVALVMDIDEWGEALVLLLREYAGPVWTEDALEKALAMREAAGKMKGIVMKGHPYRRGNSYNEFED